MRATGIVRRIDDLGRVVIPKEIRRTLKIREGDPLEIYTDETGVYLKKVFHLDMTANLKSVLNSFLGSDCEKSEEVKSIAYALSVVLTKEEKEKS